LSLLAANNSTSYNGSPDAATAQHFSTFKGQPIEHEDISNQIMYTDPDNDLYPNSTSQLTLGTNLA